jgi:predicted TIM-barrel fold metal-dependent hydrolase
MLAVSGQAQSMRIIDGWVNVDMPEWGEEPWMLAVAERYLGSGRAGLRRLEASELLEEMDAAGVEKAILDLDLDHPSAHTICVVEAAPDRLALAGKVDPRSVMGAVGKLRSAAADLPLVSAKVIPFMQDLPPTHSSHYPLYGACVELGLPIQINTGIPGPPLPSACQDPIHLDRVCFDFSDLTVVMAHGADPWWDVAIRLMIKWPNLHLMMSAYRPKYLPESLLHYMRTRGPDKVMFASDHPLLELDKCIADLQHLDLPPEALDAYAYANAARLFFPA